jgi:hypothetical protein
MSRSATVLGCALALTVGIQVAEASSCIDHQLVDKLGQIVRDANGNAVACGVDPNAGNPESFAGDQGLYLGAGALLIGGGIAAALATTNNNGGGGSSQQNQLLYTLLLNNNNPGGGVGSPASP